MRIEVTPIDVEAVTPMRDLFRAEAACQIVHDSILQRRLADAYVLRCEGEDAGYGGVWNQYFPHRIVEFFIIEKFRKDLSALFRAFTRSSGACEIEAQTNMPRMLELVNQFGADPVEEKILFQDGSATILELPGGMFRLRRPGDEGPEGEWVVELDGKAVAAGGILTHYNPPYGDLYMEVESSARRRGTGSYIVQELRRACREAGLVPAARCDPDNIGSWRTLERGGMEKCGELVAASIRPEYRQPGEAGDAS